MTGKGGPLSGSSSKHAPVVAMPRLLIINCASPYFFYIPMGSFGLCDFLAQQGVGARIFSPSLYPEVEMKARLMAVLETERPSHVGLVCHWQETAHGLLEALALVRGWSGDVVTVGGGFTASFFAEDLLNSLPGLDYVVTGDPERTMLALLQGEDPPTIANLVRREDGRAVRNDRAWLMDASTLESIAFGDLRFLVDSPRYIDKINTRLGFPLMLGRGCVFDCAYCGGSRHAFRLHSGRHKPVVRSHAAVLGDLHRLKAHTRILYLCYENDQASIVSLFRAIAADPELRGHFTLHYGAWHLVDAQFLEAYRAAFDCTGVTPIFEFSPEVIGDQQRQAIKRGTTYTLEDFERNCGGIAAYFNGKVRIEVFFSRYHPALSGDELQSELGELLAFKQRMLLAGLPVHTCFDHLSTDVASRYWQESRPEPQNFTRFLEQKQRVDQGDYYPFPMDNLCLLIPEHLPTEFVHGFEALVFILERLERSGHELVHILTAWYGRYWLNGLRDVVEGLRHQEEAAFFSAPPLDTLLELLAQHLRADENIPPPPFLVDLIRYTRKKVRCLAEAVPPARAAGEDTATAYQLNLERVSIHEQDYPDLQPLLTRLHHRDSDPIAYQRTACLFCSAGLLSLPHAAYRTLLRPFEHPTPLAAHLSTLDTRHHDLIFQLIQENVLVPVAID
jgi:hypothetical protein